MPPVVILQQLAHPNHQMLTFQIFYRSFIVFQKSSVCQWSPWKFLDSVWSSETLLLHPDIWLKVFYIFLVRQWRAPPLRGCCCAAVWWEFSGRWLLAVIPVELQQRGGKHTLYINWHRQSYEKVLFANREETQLIVIMNWLICSCAFYYSVFWIHSQVAWSLISC